MWFTDGGLSIAVVLPFRRIQPNMLKVHQLPSRLLAALVLSLVSVHAQQTAPTQAPAEDYVRSHYTKYEYRIPMRDGKRLFTAVYVPKDAFDDRGHIRS